jgi:hypothetical protein
MQRQTAAAREKAASPGRGFADGRNAAGRTGRQGMNDASAGRERLVPDEPFPPYAYVSGRFPHPVSDPAGHSYGVVRERPAPPDPHCWQACRPYLLGLDLFNHGYYWEAHEVWEGLWHACGRAGPLAGVLKGLIKLAAAGVKVREGRPAGVRSHAARAAGLFRQAAAALGPDAACYLGLDLHRLAGWAEAIAARPEALHAAPAAPVEVVFPFVLRPAQEPPPGAELPGGENER